MSEKVLNDTVVEVVAPQESTEAPSVETSHAADDKGAVAKPKQSAEDNAKFAEMRRRTEQLEKQVEEAAERAERYRLAFEAAKESDGWRGDDPLAFADEKISERTGRTPEEIRAEREAKKAQDKKLKEFEGTADELARLRQELVFQQDLLTLKNAFPDEKFTHVKELGDMFIGLRASGIDAVSAYTYIKGANAQSAEGAKGEAEMGAVATSKSTDTEYFTSSQLDNLTQRQLDDPKIMAKALKSIERLSRLNKK